MGRQSRVLMSLYKAIKPDIFKMCEVMRFAPTTQQADLLRAVQRAQMGLGSNWIACKSGQGPGKTTVSVIIAAWRCMQAVDALTVVTAPTSRQCREVWLAEFRRVMERADPLLQKMIVVTKTKVVIGGRADWGVKTVTATREENAQGFHEKNMTVIIEEASGVSREIVTQFKGTLSNPNALLLQIGNPNCIMADMDIYSPSLGRVPIESFEEGEVVSLDESSLLLSKEKARAVMSGTKECVQVTLASGQVLRLSHDHPLYTEEGWKEASLCLNNLVAAPACLHGPENPLVIDRDKVRFTGYMLADGCSTYQKGNHARCGFTQAPGAVLSDFLSLSMCQEATVREEGRGSKAVRVSVRGQNPLLRELSLAGHNAHTKRVPPEFFLMSDENIAEFLNCFWACDGSFNRYGPKVCLCNRKLLEDIRTLLLRLGIYSRVWHTPVKNTKTFDYLNGREFDAWTLAITERPSILKWLGTVGEVLGKEGKCIVPAGTNPNCHIVPVGNKELEDILMASVECSSQRAVLRHRYRRNNKMSLLAFRRLCEDTGYDGEYTRFLNTQIRWEKVKSIEHIGEHKVYDLTVPSSGNFVCENVIVHNTRDCDFFDCFNANRDRWECLTFNAEDTARDFPHIVNPQRNKDLEEEFGKDSDVYRVRVLGEFPHSDPNCVMSSDDLEACMKRELMVPMAALPGGRGMGIDLARFGGDENTVFRRSGQSIVEWWKASRVDPSVAVNEAYRMQAEAGWPNDSVMYTVDAGGIGQGIMHKFYDAGKRLWEFHNGGTAQESDKYANAITEAWFNLARKVKARKCYLPNDRLLLFQLTTRQYSTNKDGLLVIEPKDQYMKRGFDSPDRADGVVYAFHDLLALKGKVTARGHSVKRVGLR